jgi:hypothetical protein
VASPNQAFEAFRPKTKKIGSNRIVLSSLRKQKANYFLFFYIEFLFSLNYFKFLEEKGANLQIDLSKPQLFFENSEELKKFFFSSMILN